MDENNKSKSKYATVGQLIDYLRDNFRRDDALCFWYEGGAYMNCERVPSSFIGDRMFVYVKDDKDKMIARGHSKKSMDEDYQYVQDNDVLVY